KIEITANGVAALISCHLNFLKEGTLQNIKEPYIRIGESIQSCLYMMSENDSVINNDMDKLNATFYLNITKEFEKSQELNELLLSNDKINLMYYGWIIQMLYYIVADNLLGKLLDSNDFELVYILSNKDLDKNRYKDFLKKHLKRIIENFDILLEKHDKNIYKDFKNIKYSLEKKLEDFEVKIYKDDFKKHYLWLKLKSNSKQALFVTPRSSTTSFPKSPKDGKDAEETHSNISKKPKFEDVLSNMSASPIVKRVLYLVNGEIEGEKSEKNKTTENLENLFKSIAITHIFTSRDTSDIANILLGVNIKGKKIEESHFLHTDAKKSFSEIINKCNEKNGYKVEKNSYIKRLTNKWKKVSRIKFIEMADKDDTVKIVIVADRNIIGVIHQLITGQWVAAEPGSVSKFVEFEFAQNDEQPEGEPTYKNFRLVRSNDVNHLEKYRRVDPSDGFTLTLKK
uniref:DUF1729 domain-containing protein n=1 Tax=Meloidogyne hapla TaxID=6305 RepID=A0A1I8B7N2_MELHA